MKDEKNSVEEQEEKVENTAENEETTGSEDSNPEEELSDSEKKDIEIQELKDKHLRLYSEFDNFRRRTQKEKLELYKTAGEDIFKALLPVMDDFERALQNMDKKGDVKTIRQGVDLVFNKFKSTLESKGLKSFKSIDQDFDPEIHEAITRIPAPNKKQIGKVVDEVEKGYMLNDKVIRYAKVVVGQ